MTKTARAELIPTPVTKADLADSTADINQINDGVATLEAQPRTRVLDWITVRVTDAEGDDGSEDAVYYTQKRYMSEWVRYGAKIGNAKIDADGDDWVIPVADFEWTPTP